MAIVTIRGQSGSWAPEIGEAVAVNFHADYVDREIIAQVASVLNKRPGEVAAKEESPVGLLGRVARALERGYPLSSTGSGAGGIDPAVYAPTWEIPLDDSQYLSGLRSVIKALASGGSIVVAGRGSQFILKDHPGALHVLVVAPLEIRVRRVMESHHLNEKTARKEIEHEDSSRRQFIRQYFKAELWDPTHYDLVINSEHLSIEAAASIIANAAMACR